MVQPVQYMECRYWEEQPRSNSHSLIFPVEQRLKTLIKNKKLIF